jgi:hypothetical protein
MVGLFIAAALSAENDEDAVAFADAGNAILNKKGRCINAGEQAIKI